jgi:hypothetical protein
MLHLGPQIVGPQIVVDRDPPWAVRDPGSVQPRLVHFGPSPHRDQERIASDRLAAGVYLDPRPIAGWFYRLHGRRQPQLDPAPPQRLDYGLAGFRFVVGQQPVRRFHQGYPRSQTLACLRQLAPDGAASDDDQLVRQHC